MPSCRSAGSRGGAVRGGLGLLTGVLAVLGCGIPAGRGLGSDGVGGTTSSPAESSAAVPDGSADIADLGGLDDGPERRDANFLAPLDLGPWQECDLWSQDCPVGEKCNAFANDGGGAWNANGCFPIDPDPDDVGEPCTVVDSGVSGIDSCALGSMCWNVDPYDGVGTCVSFCGGSEANPICEDPTLHCVGRTLTICLPSCCPLEQSCGAGEACYPENDSFGCAPDVSGVAGGFADPCEFINVCDPGLFCADAERVPGCEGSTGCCTPYCEVGSWSCWAIHPDLECVPWFEVGQAPFGEEHVGACLLPE